MFTGSGLLAIFICLFNYIIDSYLMFPASAIAANTFLRSIVGSGFPLFSRQMFDNLGIHWAGMLLGRLAAAMVPIPLCFYLFGAKLRQESKRIGPTMKSKPIPAKDSEAYNSDERGDLQPHFRGIACESKSRIRRVGEYFDVTSNGVSSDIEGSRVESVMLCDGKATRTVSWL